MNSAGEVPARVLRDPAVWAQHWYDLREQLAENTTAFNRWKAGAPGCA